MAIDYLGKIKHQTLNFNPGINHITSENGNELLMAIKMLFYLEKQEPVMRVFGLNTVIKGTIEIEKEKEVFDITVFFNGKSPEYKILNIKTGKDITLEYTGMMNQSEENKAADIFFNDVEYHKRMCRILNPSKEDRQIIPKCTNGLGDTQTCRKYLKEVINSFQDKAFINVETGRLCLSKQGEFFLEEEQGNSVLANNLEESEKKIFELRCFLAYSEIWNELELIKDFNHIEKPILIAENSGFPDQKMAATIMKKILDSRQVFIIN